MALFNSYMDTSIQNNHYTNFGVNHELLKNKIIETTGADKVILACNATVILDGLHDILSSVCNIAFLPSFTFPATNQGCRIKRVYSETIATGSDIGRPFWGVSDYDSFNYTSYAVTVNPFGSLSQPYSKPDADFWVVDNAAGVLSQAKAWLDAGADAVVYSLHATKILSACEGGVVLFNNQYLYEKYLKYINFSFDFDLGGNRFSGEKGSNHKMSELNAAWCLMNLYKLPDNLHKREKVVKYYKEFCESKNIPFIYSLQAFWLLGKKPANDMVDFAKSFDVEVKPYYQKLHSYNIECDQTDIFNRFGFCIPTRPNLDDDEIAKILAMLRYAQKDNLI